jgi:hypothetical protein
MKTAWLLATVLVLSGCYFDHVGPLEHSTQSVELDKSEMVNVELRMGAGELRVEGGSARLMEADFTCNIPSWKPIVNYDSSSFRGRLTVEQPAGIRGGGGPGSTYKWDLRLNNDRAIDMVAHLGAGEARLDLGSLNLRRVEINMGVGELRLDLRGTPKRDYDVKIKGGVGQATVRLPSDVGVDATATGGIGDIQVRGLEKRDGRWINPAHQHAPVTIHLDVSGGVGNITISAE